MKNFVPEGAPEPGFYHHYKHDPNGLVENYAYEVLGAGTHTETKEELIFYRALYGEGGYFARPLKMWDEEVNYPDGRRGPRFVRITDKVVVAILEECRDKIYLR